VLCGLDTHHLKKRGKIPDFDPISSTPPSLNLPLGMFRLPFKPIGVRTLEEKWTRA